MKFKMKHACTITIKTIIVQHLKKTRIIKNGTLYRETYKNIQAWTNIELMFKIGVNIYITNIHHIDLYHAQELILGHLYLTSIKI